MKTLTPVQQSAITRLIEHDYTLMVAQMGSGKTAITLHAIEELFEMEVLTRVLIVAPLRVCKTVWPQEKWEWPRLNRLTISCCAGLPPKDRLKVLESGSNIIVINFEMLPWLVRETKFVDWGFDGLVIDELSRMKAVGGAQFKALRKVVWTFSWRVGLTGTPVSEDLIGLYGQAYMVDGGFALGRSKDNFLRRYFYHTDYMGYDWRIQPHRTGALMKAVEDLVYVVEDYRDELPPIRDILVELVMPPRVRKCYDAMCNDMLVESVEAVNAAVQIGKLQQINNGFLYDTEAETTIEISDYRLLEILSAIHERKGSVMVVYEFTRDMKRLRALCEDDGLVVMEVRDPGAVDAWMAGQLDVLLAHPKSCGHGLNLAPGGHEMIWVAPCWSRDQWLQTRARLWRRGQTADEVVITTFQTKGSVDEIVRDRVEGKADFEVTFLEHLARD